MLEKLARGSEARRRSAPNKSGPIGLASTAARPHDNAVTAVTAAGIKPPYERRRFGQTVAQCLLAEGVDATTSTMIRK
jgi:hypothetical protein